MTKKMENTHTRKGVPVRSKDGRKITTESRQRERLKEHLEEVWNIDGPTEAVEQIQSEELDINTLKY